MGMVQSGVQHVRPGPSSSSHKLTSITGQRSYAKQTVYDAHLSSKKHIKAAAKASEASAPSVPTNGNGQNSSSSSSPAKLRSPARLTYLITALLVPLQSTLAETKANVERRFSLTVRERETELVEDVQSAAPVPAADGVTGEVAEEPEEEEKIYNPLKLPLGWDGKPIPYWLYKLHGLGVEYRCEICSDHVYMGRKNFERHFQVRPDVS
jgi:splicing factor 3A subunit 3